MVYSTISPRIVVVVILLLGVALPAVAQSPEPLRPAIGARQRFVVAAPQSSAWSASGTFNDPTDPSSGISVGSTSASFEADRVVKGPFSEGLQYNHDGTATFLTAGGTTTASVRGRAFAFPPAVAVFPFLEASAELSIDNTVPGNYGGESTAFLTDIFDIRQLPAGLYAIAFEMALEGIAVASNNAEAFVGVDVIAQQWNLDGSSCGAGGGTWVYRGVAGGFLNTAAPASSPPLGFFNAKNCSGLIVQILLRTIARLNTTPLIVGAPTFAASQYYDASLHITKAEFVDGSNHVIEAVDTSGLNYTHQPPHITSANVTTFTSGVRGSFTVTTTGLPTVDQISVSGTLPPGLSFVNNVNGTADIIGTALPGTGGTYPLTITASNGLAPDAVQTFQLSVLEPPKITSASSATFKVGTFGTFTVTTTGFPAIGTISEAGALPQGLKFVNNGNGTATLSGIAASGAQGSYQLRLTAANGVAPDAVQTLQLTVAPPDIPSYSFDGFYQPIDMSVGGVIIWNAAKAGQVVPVKWRLTSNGVPVSDVASFVRVVSSPISCESGTTSVESTIGEQAPGNAVLEYLGDGYWQYNWQTAVNYKGTCRSVTVLFSDGSTSLPALFRFK